MRPLGFDEGDAEWVFSSVKSLWEEDVRQSVLKKVRKHLEGRLKVEFKEVVGCGRYGRSKNRRGQRNGFYKRGLQTVYGWLTGSGCRVYAVPVGSRKCWRSTLGDHWLWIV